MCRYTYGTNTVPPLTVGRYLWYLCDHSRFVTTVDLVVPYRVLVTIFYLNMASFTIYFLYFIYSISGLLWTFLTDFESIWNIGQKFKIYLFIFRFEKLNCIFKFLFKYNLLLIFIIDVVWECLFPLIVLFNMITH